MGNKASKAIGQSGSAKEKYVQQNGATIESKQTNVQSVQNVLLIWLDSKIDNKNPDCRNTITQLRRTVNDINTFTDEQECIRFINTITDNKACIIISGAYGQRIVPRIHNMSQVDSIFIFCGNKEYHEQWAKDWSKIKGVFTKIEPICGALKQAAQQCEQDAISISFVATHGDISKNNLDQLDPIFMYSQILKEILLTIKFDDGHIKEFLDHCRSVFTENEKELQNVVKLQTTYHTKTPIWWYSCESFLYPMLNYALRIMNLDIIIKMGFFISDLHRHIEQLHSKQFIGTNSNEIFTVYRGQGISKTDFDRMKNIRGGLMSFNNFLSTSKSRQVSLGFAWRAIPNDDMMGILFVMTIDPMKSTTPFASIADIAFSGNREDEVLFSMHTVFRIGEITCMDKSERLFQVQLTLTSDDDKDLHVLTDRIREETYPDEEGWSRLGSLLLKVGESVKAQHVYEMLLKQTTNESEKASIYNQLGWTKDSQGEYDEAILLYAKALEIYRKTLSPTHLSLATCYNNIGGVYFNAGDYPKSLSYYKKALEIRKQSLPSNHPDLSVTQNSIGAVYCNMGDYPKALSCYEEALEIKVQSLPSNHPDFGISYNNIGNVYFYMGDYTEALSYYEKAFEIQTQALPSNHPSLSASYTNIGNVYFCKGDYPKSLSYYEKALEIRKQSLPSNHPDLGSSYNNIGEVYSKRGDYPKALSYYEKTLEIKQQLLPPNHPDFGICYNNIGESYSKMGDYLKALVRYEKALEIRKQSLPPNHPDFSISYNNIGNVYCSMGEYPKALSYYEKAIEIKKQSLPPNHPEFGICYNYVGEVHFCMGDYSKSLSFHEKALEIQRQSLPSNHPDFGISYNNIGNVYCSMRDYPKALSHYEKDLDISKKLLPANHPDLGSSYNNIGNIYYSMNDYPKAHSFYERAVEIGQHSLPANHTHLQLYKENLDNVKKKL